MLSFYFHESLWVCTVPRVLAEKEGKCLGHKYAKWDGPGSVTRQARDAFNPIICVYNINISLHVKCSILRPVWIQTHGAPSANTQAGRHMAVYVQMIIKASTCAFWCPINRCWRFHLIHTGLVVVTAGYMAAWQVLIWCPSFRPSHHHHRRPLPHHRPLDAKVFGGAGLCRFPII